MITTPFPRLGLHVLALLLAFSNLPVMATDDVASLIAKGDNHDRAFEPDKALHFYLEAEKATPKDASLLTRIARQYRHLMVETGDRKEKLRLGKISLDYALRASELAPNDPEAQISPAISYGKMMPYLGQGAQVKASPHVKSYAERTIALDPKHDTAWHILGRWHRVLADVNSVERTLAGAIFGKLPKTTNEAAETCLKKAIAINPKRLMHHVELGRIYAQMGRKEDARKSLKKGLAMPSREHDDPETKAVARETLKTLE